MVGTGGWAFLLLGGAFVVAIDLTVLLVHLFVHCFAAVGAEHKACEQIRLLVGFTAVNVPLKERLRFIKGFAVDDRLVGVFDDDPLVLRHSAALVHLVIDRAAARFCRSTSRRYRCG